MSKKSFLDKKDKRSLTQKNKTDDKIQEKFTMDSSFWILTNPFDLLNQT